MRHPPGEARIALIVRLERKRHMRLKIFAARHQQTSQNVIVSALDAYLDARDAACVRAARRADAGH